MSDVADPAREVLVVLDPDFGDRLRQAWHGQAVWITMSPANAPVVRALWASVPSQTHLTGITGFRYSNGVAAEDCLLDELDAIQLHHGPHSTSAPCTIFKVIGVPLTAVVQNALSKLDFKVFQKCPHGFVATRSEEEAKLLRN
jgi:hypothetical protein